MKKILLTAIVALFAITAVSAQEKGNWGVGPKLGIYTNTGDGAIFSLGASGRYSFTDHWRVEASLMALFHDHCSIDFNAEAHYLFKLAPSWRIYPLAGIGVNQIGVWSCGISLGGGVDFAVARRWDLTAAAKWMIQTAEGTKNPIVINIGAAYKF